MSVSFIFDRRAGVVAVWWCLSGGVSKKRGRVKRYLTARRVSVMTRGSEAGGCGQASAEKEHGDEDASDFAGRDADRGPTDPAR